MHQNNHKKWSRNNRMQRKRQKRVGWIVLGFSVIVFLLGFVCGRMVLAAEQRIKAAQAVPTKTEEPNPFLHKTNEILGEEKTNKNENVVVKQAEEKSDEPKQTDWRLILVNREHPMPVDYTVELVQVGDGHQVDERIADALKDMIAAGKGDGHSIWIVSSYRTMEKQTELYKNKVAKLRQQGYSEKVAEEMAGSVVAIPGTSEHQLGLAVDLVSSEYTKLDEGQEQTKSYQWLKAHCAEFGFILRYPNGKTEITGIIYEPWHFRYVGKEAAAEIMEQGICLEEYLKPKAENGEERNGEQTKLSEGNGTGNGTGAGEASQAFDSQLLCTLQQLRAGVSVELLFHYRILL